MTSSSPHFPVLTHCQYWIGAIIPLFTNNNKTLLFGQQVLSSAKCKTPVQCDNLLVVLRLLGPGAGAVHAAPAVPAVLAAGARQPVLVHQPLHTAPAHLLQ